MHSPAVLEQQCTAPQLGTKVYLHIHLETLSRLNLLAVSGESRVYISTCIFGKALSTEPQTPSEPTVFNETLDFQANFASDWNGQAIDSYLKREKASMEAFQLFTSSDGKEHAHSLGSWYLCVSDIFSQCNSARSTPTTVFQAYLTPHTRDKLTSSNNQQIRFSVMCADWRGRDTHVPIESSSVGKRQHLSAESVEDRPRTSAMFRGPKTDANANDTTRRHESIADSSNASYGADDAIGVNRDSIAVSTALNISASDMPYFDRSQQSARLTIEP